MHALFELLLIVLMLKDFSLSGELVVEESLLKLVLAWHYVVDQLEAVLFAVRENQSVLQVERRDLKLNSKLLHVDALIDFTGNEVVILVIVERLLVEDAHVVFEGLVDRVERCLPVVGSVVDVLVFEVHLFNNNLEVGLSLPTTCLLLMLLPLGILWECLWEEWR